MVHRAMVLLCLGFMTVLMASCGQTYKLQYITVAPGASVSSAISLGSIGSTQPLTVTAHFSNTKTEDVTGRSKYTFLAPVAPAVAQTAVSVNVAGVVEDIGKGCVVANSRTSIYNIVVTYSGSTTLAFVSVISGC